MLIGYARTSTVEQVAGPEAQETVLVATGCNKGGVNFEVQQRLWREQR